MLHRLQRLWLIEATRHGVLPLDDRAAERFIPELAGRPQLIRGNTQVLFPGMGHLNESSVINVKNRSHAVTAQIMVPEADVEGIILSQGGMAGGWSLYTRDGHLRYYLMPLQDMWTDVFAAVPGKRTSGTRAGHFAVVPPPPWQGKLPADMGRIDAPTPYVWVIARTQANGPGDYPAVNRVQDGFAITPLSRWGRPPQPVPVAIDPAVDMTTTPVDQVSQMPAAAYFAFAAELLKLHPPHVTDWSILARMKRIGLEPGMSFDIEALDPAVRHAVEQAAPAALHAIQAKVPSLAPLVNGWQVNTDTMGVYGNS